MAWISIKFEAENKQKNPQISEKKKLKTPRACDSMERWEEADKEPGLSKAKQHFNMLTIRNESESWAAWYQNKRKYIGKRNHSGLWLEILDAKHLPKFVLKYEVKHHLWRLQGLEQQRFLFNSVQTQSRSYDDYQHPGGWQGYHNQISMQRQP